MAVLSAVPKNYYNDHKTSLQASMTSTTQTTNIILNPLSRNGATAAWAATTGGVLRFYNSTQVEHIGFGSATLDASNNITLVDVTRDLPFNDSTSWTTNGAGIKWPAGTTVELVWDSRAAQKTAFLDQANTFAAQQTFAAGLRFSGTSDTIVPLSVTTTQRNNLSAAEGMVVYNSTTKTLDQYTNTSWTQITANTLTVPVTVAQGGTGLSTYNQGDIPYASAANTIAALAKNASASRYLSNSGASNAPAWAQVDLTNGVTGVLPTANMTAVTTLFGTGADGSPTWTSGATLNPATAFNYTTNTLPISQTLALSSANTVALIKSTGDVTINGTIDLDSKGGAGGTAPAINVNGNSGTAGNSVISGWTTGGGSPGVHSSADGGGGGGGASAIASAGAGATGGTGATGGAGGVVISANQLSFLSNLIRGITCGAGGASGSSATGAGTGTGGAGALGGGALIWMVGGNLALGASSTIRCRGAAGTGGGAGGGAQGGGGGGGGGGGCVLFVVAGTVTNSGATLQATGGALGAAGGGSGGGGGAGSAGADGKILIYSLSTNTVVTS